MPASDLPECLGSSLVVTCISNDPAFRARFVASPQVDRLNFGPLSTTQIGWDQPHEGNLFEHLTRDARFSGSPERRYNTPADRMTASAFRRISVAIANGSPVVKFVANNSTDNGPA